MMSSKDFDTIKEMFACHGILTRKKYALALLCIFGLGCGINLILFQINPYEFENLDGIVFSFHVTLLAILTSSLARRIRDTGNNPWLSLLIFIPVVNLIIILYYTFIKSKKSILTVNKDTFDRKHSALKSLFKIFAFAFIWLCMIGLLSIVWINFGWIAGLIFLFFGMKIAGLLGTLVVVGIAKILNIDLDAL